MRIVCFSILVWLTFSSATFGKGLDTILVSHLSDPLWLHPRARIMGTPNEIPVMEAWKKSFQFHGRSSATIGYAKDIYWVAFTIVNDLPGASELLVEIPSPSIDKILWYTIRHDSASLLATTGDSFPFSQRPVINKNFLFPIKLNARETRSFLFKVDKRNTSLYLPIKLWKSYAFTEADSELDFVYGLYFGVVIIFSVFGLLGFIFLRKAIYLWYFFWVVIHALNIFTNLGLSFQFIYPNATDLNGRFSTYVIMIGFICLMKFSVSFLNAKASAPKSTFTADIINLALLFMAFASFPLYHFFVENSLIVLQLVNVMILANCAILCYIIFVCYKSNRSNTRFYIGAFSFRMASIFAALMIEFGILNANFPIALLGLIGSVMEMSLFAFGFIYQIRKVYDERNDFLNKINLQKKEMLKAFMDGVDKERTRIAMDLHDNIGSRMSNLKRLIKTPESGNRMEEQIDTLCDDIRSMSHELSPASLKYGDLFQRLQELIGKFNFNNKVAIEFQYYDFPERLPDALTIQLYRVLQEAFENIFKHAHATAVDIQLFKHDNVLVVTVEDNGVGFEVSSLKSGNGLNNMKARIENLNGFFEINSKVGSGTQMLIRIPSP